MKRRISFFLAMLLCFSLLFSVVPPTAMAADHVHMSFKDLPEVGTWQYESIAYCYENGIMNGMSATEFSPNGDLTRGQLVTVLYRVAGQPAISYEKVFPDVAAKEYYTLPIIWAAKNGIVNGFEDGTFRPKTPVTREQLATILYRYSGSPDVSGDLRAYPDASAVQSYSRIPMLWATQNGFLPGETEAIAVRLAPRANAARVQIAGFIMRFLEKDNSEAEKISLTFTRDTWPIVDGATAFLPFYQEMAARMLGVSTAEAADYILCSTTDYAYPYLWEKKVDLVYCLRPSEEQVKSAAQNGVVFEEVPFANEGFVFFVNKDNPVDSITVQQLHDIYAGKITNWKELGGNDEEIIAYQRTEGSGSQTGLYLHVIDPDEVQEPPKEQRIGTMSEIIDVVASYKDAAGAIGYSYRYFVTNMHYDEQIKMLKVNGVYPDYASIADGSYPLISDVCTVFREDEPADSAVRKIARWCASSQGAVLAKELGYVPTAEAIGTLYKEDEHTSGDVSLDYAKGNPCPECTVLSTYYKNNLSIQDVRVEDGLYVQISGLKNKEIENAVNKKIHDTFMELSGADYPHYPGIRTRIAMCDVSDNPWITTVVRGNFNNILSITFNKRQDFWRKKDGRYGSDSVHSENIFTLNLDLRTGKEIYIGDLFADSVDGVAYINAKIAEESAKPEAFDEPPTDYYAERTAKIYFRKAFAGINRNQKFYLTTTDGALHIILDDKNPEIANLFAPTDYAIDLRGINAYERRFMTAQSLFTDGASTPSLFAQCLDDMNDAVESKMISQLSDGRKISANIIFHKRYDDKTLNLLKSIFLSDEYLAGVRADAEAKYDAYLQAGYDTVEIHASIEPSVRIYGDYTSMIGNIDYSINGYNESEDLDLYDLLWETRYACYDADGKPVSLKDIFIPDCNYNTIMEEAAVKNLKEAIGNQYPEESYRAMFRELLENMDGFEVQNDALHFYCDTSLNIIRKHTSSNSTDSWKIQSILQKLSYKDIGEENLTIFN